MKHINTILLVACLLIAATTTTFAQKNIGIRAGWNSTSNSVDLDELGDISSQSDLYVGIFKEFNLISKVLYLVPELQYSKQGFKSVVLNNEKTYSMDYLNVPVLAKVYVLKFLSFEAGPQFGFKLNDNLDGTETEDFDTGFAGGIGFNLPFGFSINGRYIYGLSDVIKNVDSKNEVLQVGAAFRF